MKTALVLSGGSIKGSYQAGVVAELLAAGLAPDIITGISVGALNTAFLAKMQPTRAVGAATWEDIERDGRTRTWADAGKALTDFWLTEVTSPERIIRKRHMLEVAFRVVVLKEWDGLVDTAPLASVVDRTFDGVFPVAGPTVCRVGAVNLRTGLLEYHGSDSPNFPAAVLASTAEPVAMPIRGVGSDWYVDGGVREINPLAEAIRLGASRIVCVVCQPEQVDESTDTWKDVLHLIDRCTTLVSNEIVNNDLRVCEMINDAVRQGVMPDKREIEVHTIRPPRTLMIDIEHFREADIARMVGEGRADGRTQMPAFLKKAA